jgi:2,4-dienoyl-CoA reductase-like NADH-dependent reductase (Old Yellow Enzyme family)
MTIGGFAARAAGGITMEATAVVPEGGVSSKEAGLWANSRISPLKRILYFSHTQGANIGI